MSRSNTNYYNICTEPVAREDRCDAGLSLSRRHIPPGQYLTRRGVFIRKPRFPFGWKKYAWNPPKYIKRYWNKQLRQSVRLELIHHPEDPILTPWQKWLAGKYEYWL